eukprot:jgi/Botrbrau1/4146/Bobra.0192s0016.1
MHQHSIIHRDIKLENIFIGDDQKVRLGDFGLTMSMQQELAISPVGTVEYMAPEVVNLPPVESVSTGIVKASQIPPCTEKVDIWALGVTLYELLTGRLPFDGRDKATIKEKIRSHQIKPPPMSMSDECKEFLTHMLDPNPNHRWSASRLLSHCFLRRRTMEGFQHNYSIVGFPPLPSGPRASPVAPSTPPQTCKVQNEITSRISSSSIEVTSQCQHTAYPYYDEVTSKIEATSPHNSCAEVVALNLKCQPATTTTGNAAVLITQRSCPGDGSLPFPAYGCTPMVIEEDEPVTHRQTSGLASFAASLLPKPSAKRAQTKQRDLKRASSMPIVNSEQKYIEPLSKGRPAFWRNLQSWRHPKAAMQPCNAHDMGLCDTSHQFVSPSDRIQVNHIHDPCTRVFE